MRFVYIKPEPTDADRERVHELSKHGWIQVSRKYRRLAKLPCDKGSATEWLRDHDPVRFNEIEAKIKQRIEDECASYLLIMNPELLELTPEEFEAWIQEWLNPWGRFFKPNV